MESAPTGCFKCGRPGHWSRDCPSSAPGTGNNNSSSSPNSSAPSQIPNSESQRSSFKSSNPASTAPVPKVTKTRVQRPKLTPELLLSEDGLGYVLRYFPKSFKYRGRGKEVSDLGNLIGMYSEWHSHLFPYHSFDQFVHKVQKVSSSKRVKDCINELRERVASGSDPNKLYEKHDENDEDHQADKQDMDHEPSHEEENITTKKSVDVDFDDVDVDDNADNTNVADDDFQDNMMNEIFDNAMDSSSKKQPSDEQQNVDTSNELTEEQKARMEANRLKAMEKAQSISEEQRLRMEANRLKALGKAKARLESNQA